MHHIKIPLSNLQLKDDGPRIIMHPKEHSIMFSTPMVEAILAGTKTQTRRIIKPQPEGWVRGENGRFGIPMKKTDKAPSPNTSIWEEEDGSRYEAIKCPMGYPDDYLWVRETFAKVCYDPYDTCDGRTCPYCEYEYKADHPFSKPQDNSLKWRPSIFMPRAAARIILQITDVRPEPLNDISEEDAVNEGVKVWGNGGTKIYGNYTHEAMGPCLTAKDSFKTLWESINGPGSWDKNPVVWVISFKKI